MILACSLPYKPVDEQTQIAVIRTVRQHPADPRGLRTLSPPQPALPGVRRRARPANATSPPETDRYGPWLLAFYVRACFDIDGASHLETAEELLAGFEEEIQSYGIGSIGELYDADPPCGRGAICRPGA